MYVLSNAIIIQMSKILVVMPVYNAERTIREAIQSVLNQTHKDLTLTIVDDCSTDDSVKIAQEFLSDPRVSIYKLSQNMGAYYARNFGLFINKDLDWDFFTTHDADDVSLRHRYRSMLAIFNKPKIVAVQDIFERKNFFSKQSLGQSVTMAHAMFRRIVFDNVGYFDHSTRFAGDWEHWQRVKIFASNNNYSTAVCQEKLGISYVHNNNLTVLVPIGSDKRKSYVEKATVKLEKIMSNKKYFYKYSSSSDMYKVIKKARQPQGDKKKLKTALILLTWQRLNNLPETLRQLQYQTNKEFDLYISNANLNKANKVDRIVSQFSYNMKINLSHDGNDYYSFRRILLAKNLYDKGYDAVIFIDDDVSIPRFFVDECLSLYEPKTYKSWYAWKFNSGEDYYDRERISSLDDTVHYGGAGVAILDLSIFKNNKIINAPKEAHMIEDLWISYVVSTTRGWSVKYLPASEISLAGADKVALHKTVESSGFTKTDFLKLLVANGWNLSKA